MCGIFAALSRHGAIRKSYSSTLESLRHRGPDDSSHDLVSLACNGTEPHGRAWLGHRRLSIIDLSSAGRQPMESADGRYRIIFNGEIYNYLELREDCRAAGAEFRTETDTEVLLQAWAIWGHASLTRLKGMFAFVVVDRIDGTATLVRDCFGIKPLYFVQGPDVVLVSSEIPPLLATGEVSDALNADIVFEYLRFGATRSNDRTLLRDVRALPAAHFAVFDFRTGILSTPHRYWTLQSTERTISFSDAAEECRLRFMDNVRLHLRSDVPVGAALSGGIDSSAIVCVMRVLEPDLDLKTFSFIAADSAKSEERWVDLVHEQVGGECHKIRPTGADVGRDLELLLQHQGEPFASASIFAQFQVFQRAREAGVPVTLDGQGADELLGGYLPHVGTAAADRVRAGDVIGAMRIMTRSSPGLRGVLTMGGMLAQSVLPSRMRSMARSVVSRELVPEYLNHGWLAAEGVNAESTADALIGHYRTLKGHLIDTVEHGSLPNLLRYADRNSMAFSVESRVPFLTADFAEFLMSLPSSFHISSDGTRKHVFREAMKGILPEPIRQRRDKIGFFADDGIWLRENRQRFAEVWEEVLTMPMFDSQALARFLTDFWTGKHAKAQQVWRILVVALWWRQMRLALRRQPT
jgi:asparagine synthase (glutamine-hydrolysing)